MNPPPLYSIRDLVLSFGGKPLFQGLSLQISPRDRICLVGRNGCGKSTLLKLIAGLIEPDDGVFFTHPGTTIAYLPQDEVVPSDKTLLEYIMEYTGKPQFEVEAVLSQVDLDPARYSQALSGGEKRRLLIARALVMDPDILLLDEPTNHLDITAIEWLEETLKSFRGAFVVISHDRSFLKRVSKTTWWIDRGTLLANDKGYEDFDRWTEAVLLDEERKLTKLKAKLRLEEDWVHRGVTARRKRNQGRLRQVIAMREEKRSRLQDRPKGASLGAVSGDISSKLVIECHNLTKSFGDKFIVKGFSTIIQRGDRVGIVGANGTGKTTLLKLLLKEIRPDEGSCHIGASVQLIYLDQMRDTLTPNETLWETLCPNGGDHVLVKGKPRHVMGYLKEFLFDEKQARSPVSILSGGEKNRLVLAKAFTQPGNLLVLDEPTNDLDMDTLDLLQELLFEFEGTLIIVSHDRDFLDRLVTSVIAVEGNGQVVDYVGGYSDYLAKRHLQHKTTALASDKGKAGSIPLKQRSGRHVSYHEKREFELLPGKMAQLEQEIQSIGTKLQDPSLYQENPQEFTTLSERFEQAKVDLEEAELKWLELSDKLKGDD
jgi:ABC transport system ATP-binding/permease protein